MRRLYNVWRYLWYSNVCSSSSWRQDWMMYSLRKISSLKLWKETKNQRDRSIKLGEKCFCLNKKKINIWIIAGNLYITAWSRRSWWLSPRRTITTSASSHSTSNLRSWRGWSNISWRQKIHQRRNWLEDDTADSSRYSTPVIELWLWWWYQYKPHIKMGNCCKFVLSVVMTWLFSCVLFNFLTVEETLIIPVERKIQIAKSKSKSNVCQQGQWPDPSWWLVFITPTTEAV